MKLNRLVAMAGIQIFIYSIYSKLGWVPDVFTIIGVATLGTAILMWDIK